jgi:Tfp pilus assembly ATPase PilU
MQSFEQSVVELCEKKVIYEEAALAEADSPANLRAVMKQRGMGRSKFVAADVLRSIEVPKAQQF